MNNKDNANDRMINGPLFQLQHDIHDALRVQHPEWVEPNGDCPTCESYESRLAELLGLASTEALRYVEPLSVLIRYPNNMP